MKHCCLMILCALLLCGCMAEETYETIADEPVQSVMAQPGQISVRLPEDAVAPVLESDSGQIYMAQDYEILVQTLSSGDLQATIQTLSGYEKNQLTVVQTRQNGVDRYEFVWACAGETGDRLGRAVILDDGNYHYCMSVMRDAESSQSSQIVWRDVFESFALV